MVKEVTRQHNHQLQSGNKAQIMPQDTAYLVVLARTVGQFLCLTIKDETRKIVVNDWKRLEKRSRERAKEEKKLREEEIAKFRPFTGSRRRLDEEIISAQKEECDRDYPSGPRKARKLVFGSSVHGDGKQKEEDPFKPFTGKSYKLS